MTEKQYNNLAARIRKSFKYYEVTINVSTVLEYEVCEHGPYIGHGNFKNNTYDNNINAISCEIGKIIALVK